MFKPSMSKFWSAFPFDMFPATDVELLYKHFFRTLYNAVSKVILLKGLDELPKVDYDFVMFQLLLSGKIFQFKLNNDIYLLDGYPAGEYDVNYMPANAITSNPRLKGMDVTREIGKDGVLIYLTPFDKMPIFYNDNTRYGGGLYSLIASTATLLADNYSSLNCAQINGRAQTVYTAEDANDAKSAENTLKRLYRGVPYAVVQSGMLSKFGATPLSSNVSSKVITELIEAHQYILAQFWNSIGIDANFNMKRERLNTAEVEANSTSIKVPVSTMLNMLNNGFKTANEIFGTNISAELNPEFKPLEPESEDDSTTEDKSPKNVSNDDSSGSDDGDNKDGEKDDEPQ